MNNDHESVTPTALKGLRVVDFTHYIAGPLATMILADAGAEVIKIEKPGGDDQRHFPPRDERLNGEGASFLWANRNKRSITLDLRTEAGRKIAQDLVRSADVLVENFTSRVMTKYQLDYDTLAKENPRLIYCSVSAFGRSGSHADRPGFDTIMQAESGFVSLSGRAEDVGTRAGSPIMDISTAMMASNAILIALLARAHTGRGQFVEVPLFDTSVIMNGFAAMNYLMSDRIPKRTGNLSNDATPSGIFETADRPIFVTCAATPQFKRLFGDVLGMPEIAEDPELQVSSSRNLHRDRIYEIVIPEFRKDTRENWLRRLGKANIPAGAVNDLPEAFASDLMAERGLVSYIPHPTAGKVPNIALPLHFSDTPVIRPVAAPSAGQHSEEVVREVLGYDDQQYQQARAAGAFGGSQTD